ncbi:hypothetical protein P7G51_00355 [Enterococcus asini]|uniref:hypothetical protein n=1 Tax=Enterococcus asini TaxID=57732 RepID=UPI00288D710D|nr:hypothetical protein [Enterococcus asini]MDT2755838.1 hypothetical protein [Enterococcus asini]
MEEFRKIYSTSQQFLLLQAYVDEVLTESQLLNFMLLEDSEHRHLVFYQQGLLVIRPAFDLDQFTHILIPKDELQLSTAGQHLVATSKRGRWEVAFENEREAAQVVQEVRYVFQTAES